MGIRQAIRRAFRRPEVPLDRTGPATAYGRQAGGYASDRPDRPDWPPSQPDIDPWPVNERGRQDSPR